MRRFVLSVCSGVRRLLFISCVFFLLLHGNFAEAQPRPPLVRDNFYPMVGPPPARVPQGFGIDFDGDGIGDRQNGWAWSMSWFRNKLYVGTNRAYRCMETAGITSVFPPWPYPPLDPDVECTPDWADLPSAAEIWCWDPATGGWTRVFKSPRDVPIPNRPGKYVARDVGFRNMHVHNGTLYVSGVAGSWYIPDGIQIPSARLLYTDDGVVFNAVPPTEGTVFADLINPSFRGAVTYKDRFYIVAGDILGFGKVLEATNPKDPATYRSVTSGIAVFELAAFNGFLYFGTHNANGFEVFKTDATGDPPYALTRIMTRGGDREDTTGNSEVLSMHVFKGSLYVGGNAMNTWRGAELFRINPDDSWDLIVGRPRTGKLPLSGFGPGMGWPLNQHMWRMETFDSRLYLGTFDMTTVAKNIILLGNVLEPVMGFDLFHSDDGVYFTEIDRTGFVDESCKAFTAPICRGLNFGARSLVATPGALFLGTANYYHGLQIWAGVPSPAGAAFHPEESLRLDAETAPGKVLLAWNPAPGAAAYQVYRAGSSTVEIPAAALAAAAGADGSNGATRAAATEPLVVTQFGEYRLLASTRNAFFADKTAIANESYRYHVRAVAASGQTSGPSNFVIVPHSREKTTFSTICRHIDTLIAARKFTEEGHGRALAGELLAARDSMLRGDMRPLSDLHKKVSSNILHKVRLLPDQQASRLSIEIGRLVKRVQLVVAGELYASDVTR